MASPARVHKRAYALSFNAASRAPRASAIDESNGLADRLLTAGERPSEQPPTGLSRLHFGLLSHFKRVVDFDAEVSHRALELGMSEQQLHGPEVLRPPIDQRRFGAAQRMGAVRGRVQSDLVHPAANDPGALTR
jgi:hypothetical protein